MKDIENLVITDENTDRIFRLKDVTTITRDCEDLPNKLMRYNGQRAVGLGISTVAGGNVVNMGRAVEKRIVELASQSLLGIAFHPIYIQSDTVTN